MIEQKSKRNKLSFWHFRGNKLSRMTTLGKFTKVSSAKVSSFKVRVQFTCLFSGFPAEVFSKYLGI